MLEQSLRLQIRLSTVSFTNLQKGCEPELHLRFRFEVQQMAILAEPAPEPEVQQLGKENFLASFAIFNQNQVPNLRCTGFAPEP